MLSAAPNFYLSSQGGGKSFLFGPFRFFSGFRAKKIQSRITSIRWRAAKISI
jgi:hypothetical protein